MARTASSLEGYACHSQSHIYTHLDDTSNLCSGLVPDADEVDTAIASPVKEEHSSTLPGSASSGGSAPSGGTTPPLTTTPLTAVAQFLERGPRREHPLPRVKAAVTPQTSIPNRYTDPVARPTALGGYSNNLRPDGLSVQASLQDVPAEADAAALMSIYMQIMHPIFPVFNKVLYDQMDQLDPARTLLSQVVCLLGSLNDHSREFLRLPGSSSVLSSLEFGKRIFSALNKTLELGIVNQSVVIVQVLALMAMFLDGQSGEGSAQLSAAAIRHIYSLGYHQQILEQDLEDHSVTVLCCIWALDRLNSALHGQPVRMHESDFIGVDLISCIRAQEPHFQLFLRVVALLDASQHSRRSESHAPVSSCVEGFPKFENIVVDSGAWQASLQIIALTETLYHTAAILSERGGSQDPILPGWHSTLRTRYSALRISMIVGHALPLRLPQFPFITRALALSLSVSYLGYRQSQDPKCRLHALMQCRASCKILRKLGNMSWVAAAISERGQAFLAAVRAERSDGF